MHCAHQVRAVAAEPSEVGFAVVQQVARAQQHFLRGLAGEGQQQDGFGRHALFHQVGQAVDNGTGLAAACAGDDQQWAVHSGNGLVLGRIQFVFVIYAHAYYLESVPFGIPKWSRTSLPTSLTRSGRVPALS